ncbi:zf-HC2 domain-containing protein [Pelomonas sp. SE-A7]|uniref:anti-sigma factor family protein n=1 Tax=Pelomonas sp. SE-A7 TaxID=3054953 RepID=UPI00259D0A5C|nr:zf-HC2 domain-containing protein [Pelomonas sp. SE-A7]MDM4765090.1 zf-HC2 domain-containing protein [Pelomonas sp. SE-A7]
MTLKRTCKQVSGLVLSAEDQRLPLKERLAVRLHLWACTACTRFVGQVALMRKATARWRGYSEDSSAD